MDGSGDAVNDVGERLLAAAQAASADPLWLALTPRVPTATRPVDAIPGASSNSSGSS